MSIVPAIQSDGEKFRGEYLEACAIGCMLLSDQACQKVALVLDSRMFYSAAHQTIFKACQAIHKASGCSPDLVTLQAELHKTDSLKKVGGTDYLIQLMESVASAANAKAYAVGVREYWRFREVAKRAEELAKAAKRGESWNDVCKLMQDTGQGLSDETSDTFRMSDIDLSEHAADQGVTTGLRNVDSSSNVGGWPVGEPSMIMGKTGKGKTCLATQCIMAAADAGKKVAFATYEMNRVKIKRRMMKQLCGYWNEPSTLGLQGVLTAQADWEEALLKLDDPFYDLVIFDPSGRDSLDNTVEDLVRWTMVQKDGAGLDIMFLDYVQLLRSSKGAAKKFEDMEAVADRLKKLAMRANIAIVFLSQQNDDGHAKGTKAFEDASGLWLRISEDQESIEIAKARYGSVLKFPVSFDKRNLIYRETN
jgi:replicative DNA helicase